MNTFLTGVLLAALPLAALAAIYRIFRLLGERWRDAAIDAATCWGVFLALITEALSVPRLITRPAVAVVWFLLAAGAFLYSRLLNRRSSLPHPRPQSTVHQAAGDTSVPQKSAPTRQDWFFVGSIGILVALVGLTALLSAPNTWDAMAYHMSRIAQWMTNRDVKLYPAFYSAQLFLSPWSEYAMLHLDILYGGDRLVNLVEWMSMIGAIVGVSCIAEQLGASRRGQIFAAVACATIPNGLLEASGAMNTYVGAFWIVVAIYYVLRWNERQSLPITLAIGASIGLAIMTKGTAYILLPCVLVACWWNGPASARKLLLRRLPVLVLAILALNGPLYLRNYRLSGSPIGFSTPLGDDPLRQYANSRFSPSITFANIVKNAALHVITPSNGLNDRISQATLSALRKLRIDPNDPVSTYRGGFHFNGLSLSESRVGNPMQLGLIFVVFLLLCGSGFGNWRLRVYALGLVGSFILFCALLRWQNANGRYHLPLFALAMALVAVVLERACSRNVLAAVAWILLIAAVPFALLNSLRPLVPFRGRTILRIPWAQTYFADNHEYLIAPYQAAAKAALATTCDTIGVDASLEDFDYPMFAFLGAGRGDRSVRYAGVWNLTAAYARSDSKPPCTVVCLRCAHAPAKWMEYKQVGGMAAVFDEVAVFSKDGDIANTGTVALPTAAEREQIFQDLDRYRESPPPISLAAVDSHVTRAGNDWPRKRADLKARLDNLYTASISLWRVRDSVDPMRRKGEPIDHSRMDPVQLLAAMEVTEYWYRTEPAKIEELNALADQLYSSWDTRILAAPPSSRQDSPACPVQVETDENTAQTSQSSKRNVTVDLSECSCLGSKVHPGDLLAHKPLGLYDGEAENLTQCLASGDGPARSIWAPSASTQTAIALH